MTDNRRFTRIPFDAEVEIEFGGRRYTTDLTDISFKGLLVRALPPWDVRIGDVCLVTLTLGDDAVMLMNCTLMHSADIGAGLRIDSIDMDSLIHLRRLLELNLGDPELFERELSALHGD